MTFPGSISLKEVLQVLDPPYGSMAWRADWIDAWGKINDMILRNQYSKLVQSIVDLTNELDWYMEP